jgi:uncharacterized membrane protein YfcA
MSAALVAGVILAGLLVGVLSALFGVGGGLLMVPFMVLALGTGQHVAEGTSLLVIVPTALVGALFHRREDYVRLRLAALLAVGGIVGGYLGASLALSLDQARLRVLFGLFLVAMGARSVWQGLWQRARAREGHGRESGGPQRDHRKVR